MRAMKTINLVRQLVRVTAVAAVALLGNAAQAAAPGISGTTFNLDASAAYITQPDGATLYSWGYGCAVATTSGLLPAGIAGAKLPHDAASRPDTHRPRGRCRHREPDQ